MKDYAYFFSVCFLAAGVAQATDKLSSANIPATVGIHIRAQLAVLAERARAKEPLCPKAMTTLEINGCYSAELATTNGNYLDLVRAVGDLLHAGDEAGTASTPKTIPFDDAEAVWQTYRKMSCEAAKNVYAGTIRTSVELGCQITFARHHMNELWSVYSDVGMH